MQGPLGVLVGKASKAGSAEQEVPQQEQWRQDDEDHDHQRVQADDQGCCGGSEHGVPYLFAVPFDADHEHPLSVK